jgi:hypothetical protein
MGYNLPQGLPAEAGRAIEDFCDSAKEALGDQLAALVLFGSAAEGRLRATSDINIMAVLRAFDAQRIDGLRDALRMAHAAVKLDVMFLLDTEIADAAEAFAVKFTDILTRRVVLHGNDPLTNVHISRAATLHRVKQVLLNLTLRLRHDYALQSLREEQLLHVVADAASPLRASAFALAQLQGERPESARVALEQYVKTKHPEWLDLVATISAAREAGSLEPGKGGPTVLGLIGLAKSLHAELSKL